MARPTKLTEEVSKKIVALVRKGVPFAHACEAAGVAADTGREWLARGGGTDPARRPSVAFAAFAAEVKKARAQCQAKRVDRINRAARGGLLDRKVTRKTDREGNVTETVEEKYCHGDWTADAWHLERSDPANWGKKDRALAEAEEKALADRLGSMEERILGKIEAHLDQAKKKAEESPPCLPAPRPDPPLLSPGEGL